MGGVQAEDLHNDLDAGDHQFGHLPAQPIIGSDVGLAFAGVNDDGIHLANAGGELDVRGEGRAAHTHDTGLMDHFHQFLRGQGIHLSLCPGLDVLAQGAQMVIFNDHAHHGSTAGVGLHFNRLDLAGDRGVNRHTQTRVVTDLLAYRHRIALFHQGLAGRADVLRHGYHQNIRLREFLNGLVAGEFLVFIGVDTAEERKRHIDHLARFFRRVYSLDCMLL